MYMITFLPGTGEITSAGSIDPNYALKTLPEGAAYVDALPPGSLSDYRYINGEYVKAAKEDNNAQYHD
nr:MAG TPA: hypothetical protein [Caudoviricetes sp.]